MARIPYFDIAKTTGRAAQHFEKQGRMRKMNLFRMLAHSGEMLDGWTRLGLQILYFAKLDKVLREIAILRVGFLSRAKYEVHQHKRIAREMGFSEELIAGIESGPDAAVLTPVQRMVMRFTDDVVKNVRASDETFGPLSAVLSHQEMQELVISICYYMMRSPGRDAIRGIIVTIGAARAGLSQPVEM
jgi:alkylhydroperoxidase family enzyme